MSKIPDWLALRPARVFAVGLGSAALLFLPSRWIAAMGLSGLAQDWKPVIGGVFLACAALLTADALAVPGKHLSQRFMDWLVVRDLRRILHTLTRGEKQVLADFLLKGTKTLGFHVTDGVIAGLEKQDILMRVTSVGFHQPVFQFGMQPWAWRYLNRHPELVGLTEDEIGKGKS